VIGVGFGATFLLSSHSRSPALVLYILAVRRILSFAPLRNKNPGGQDGLSYSSNRASYWQKSYAERVASFSASIIIVLMPVTWLSRTTYEICICLFVLPYL
jgi:hypothetical protein